MQLKSQTTQGLRMTQCMNIKLSVYRRVVWWCENRWVWNLHPYTQKTLADKREPKANCTTIMSVKEHILITILITFLITTIALHYLLHWLLPLHKIDRIHKSTTIMSFEDAHNNSVWLCVCVLSLIHISEPTRPY